MDITRCVSTNIAFPWLVPESSEFLFSYYLSKIFWLLLLENHYAFLWVKHHCTGRLPLLLPVKLTTYRRRDRVQHRCRSAASARHQSHPHQNHRSCHAVRCSYAETSATWTQLRRLVSRCCYLWLATCDELHLWMMGRCVGPSASSPHRHCQPTEINN